jgi:hypothetical protein
MIGRRVIHSQHELDMQRLIPKFTAKQLKAVCTIPAWAGEASTTRDGYYLKALEQSHSLQERIWFNPETGQVQVEQSFITDPFNWRLIPELCYVAETYQISIIAYLDGNQYQALEESIHWLTNGDMFGTNYIGSWATRITVDSSYLDWLIAEKEEASPDLEDAAIAAWKAEQSLPSGYYRLNRDVALSAIQYGIFRYGFGFVEGDADGNMVDEALQIAILGEKRYC